MKRRNLTLSEQEARVTSKNVVVVAEPSGENSPPSQPRAVARVQVFDQILSVLPQNEEMLSRERIVIDSHIS